MKFDCIINPMWFYWIQVAEELKIVLCIISGVIFLFLVFFVPIYIFAIFAKSPVLEKEEKKKFKFHIIFAVCVALLLIIIEIFIPSKKTLIEMEIAKRVTYSNIETLQEQIKNSTDYILDRLEGEKHEDK